MVVSNSAEDAPWYEVLSVADDGTEDCTDCVNGQTDEYDQDSVCTTCSGLSYITPEIAANRIKY